MADLKSIRQTLQEATEDDSTGRGSGSRLAMIGGTLTLCVGLVIALVAHAYTAKDFSGIIEAIVFAIAGGGSGPYAIKGMMLAFKGKNPPSQAPGESDSTEKKP